MVSLLPTTPCGLGISATSPTTPLCTRVTAAQPLSMCPLWASHTTQTSWAGRCGPSSRRCWVSWSSQKAKSAVVTNTESHSGLPRPSAGDVIWINYVDLHTSSPFSSAKEMINLKDRLKIFPSISLCIWGRGHNGREAHGCKFPQRTLVRRIPVLRSHSWGRPFTCSSGLW